jgi:peptidoglycan/xylan/chitin deacetylase (PgdA/CDA1 family)
MPRRVSPVVAAAAAIVAAVLLFALVSCGSPKGASTTLTSASTGTASTVAPGQSLKTTTSGPSSSTTPSSSTSSTVGPQSNSNGWPSLPPATVVRHGPRDKKMIAFTFDDNYQLPKAYETLKILQEYKVPATFFVIAKYMGNGDLVRAIAKAGFEVGDHTLSHWKLDVVSEKGQQAQIGGGTDRYHAITGAAAVPLFRPPGGVYNDTTLRVAGEKGFRYVVMWDIDSRDWARDTAAQIEANVLPHLQNGSIVLLHMAAPHTAEALPTLIKKARQAGYELVTVSTLLGM